jgi:phage-related minor tail protein
LLAILGNFVGGILGFLGDVIMGLFGGLVTFLTRIVESLSGIFGVLDGLKRGLGGLVSGFTSLFTSLFPFLPPEWLGILFSGLLLTVVGIIVKKKVF